MEFLSHISKTGVSYYNQGGRKGSGCEKCGSVAGGVQRGRWRRKEGEAVTPVKGSSDFWRRGQEDKIDNIIFNKYYNINIYYY